MNQSPLELALVRHGVSLPVDGLRIADMEAAARVVGRRLHPVTGPNGHTHVVLGWDAYEPAGEARRMPRRGLTVGATKVLIVAVALLAEVETSDGISPVDIASILERLTGRTHTVGPALETLEHAGLLARVDDRWMLGTVTATWDTEAREAIKNAVRRLRDHPNWQSSE
ncbi:hypothetical protein [Micromonospora sp. 067-2]|uniref:hypothetical protein n=1 Tax=Micromonospora sp. 067-2 TaxID=2789270 RepID=UPI0039789314